MAVTDLYKRPLQQLRISVIDQCNLRCTYCMPAEVFGADYAFLPPSKLLTFDEIETLVQAFSAIGVRKVRLTGGEPLLRKNIDELIKRLCMLEQIDDVALTTNGLLLGVYAKRLKDAGLQRVNVSLDSLHNETFQRMNGRNVRVEKVIHSLQQAAQAGLDIKINMVVQKGVNDAHVVDMAKFCFANQYTLRFIEFMDVGNANQWSMAHVVPSVDILKQLEQHFQLEKVGEDSFGAVAKYYRHKGTTQQIGFISSVSDAFCGQCNRARISADGHLYTCLFASTGTDLKRYLQHPQQLVQQLANLWRTRDDRYSEERSVHEQPKRSKIEMSYIGG